MTLLYILLGVAALIVLTLVIPVEIEFFAAIHGRVTAQTRYKLLFGLVSFVVYSGTRRKVPGKTGTDGVTFLEKLFNTSQIEGIWPWSWGLVKRLVSCVEVKRLAIDLTVSLGDDYYTGMLAGLAIPLVLYLDQRFDGGISVRPAFEEDLLLEGDLLAGFSLQPLKMIVLCLFFTCSPQFLRVKGILGGAQ